MTVTQDETSITLQWKKVNGIIGYRLKFTGREIHVNASAEYVSHAILGLTSGRKYNFDLFAVFANITSAGVNHTAVTGNLFVLLPDNRRLLLKTTEFIWNLF